MKYNNTTSLFLSIVTLLFSFSFESVYGIFTGDRVRAILEFKDHLITHFPRVFTLVFMRRVEAFNPSVILNVQLKKLTP